MLHARLCTLHLAAIRLCNQLQLILKILHIISVFPVHLNLTKPNKYGEQENPNNAHPKRVINK